LQNTECGRFSSPQRPQAFPCGFVPEGVPQREQKRAPGAMSSAQREHFWKTTSWPPQLAQKRASAAAG
jgi:hypothetical protein